MAYTGDERYRKLICGRIEGCKLCDLSHFRTNVVIYRGNPRSNLMLVGEAPGLKEDQEGKPMVGPTGSYLVRVLAKLDVMLKHDYYITNCVLCRPSQNSDPTPEQLNSCAGWLNLQIDLVKPKWIIAAGRYAASRLIPEFDIRKTRITRVEGTPYVPPHLGGIEVIPIQHPSAIKRSQNPMKSDRYEEMIRDIIYRIMPEKRKSI